MVNSIGSNGDAISFLNDVILFGRPYFNIDTAGFAVIKSGAKNVDITFEREYLDQPIVNATISIEASDSISAETLFESNLQYAITKKKTQGFTIILNKPAPNDIRFSWIAIAVKEAKVFNSIDLTPISEPTPLETPIPIPDSTPSANSEPASSPQVNPSETPNPTPSELVSPEPTSPETPTP